MATSLDGASRYSRPAPNREVKDYCESPIESPIRYVTILDIQNDRLAGIWLPGGLPQHDDLSMQSWGQFQQADGSQAQVFVLRKGRATAIEQNDAITIFQGLLMCVARHHDLHWGGEKLLQLTHGTETAA